MCIYIMLCCIIPCYVIILLDYFISHHHINLYFSGEGNNMDQFPDYEDTTHYRFENLIPGRLYTITVAPVYPSISGTEVEFIQRTSKLAYSINLQSKYQLTSNKLCLLDNFFWKFVQDKSRVNINNGVRQPVIKSQQVYSCVFNRETCYVRLYSSLKFKKVQRVILNSINEGFFFFFFFNRGRVI